MIRAVIFDCFGVFYVDPVFAYMRDRRSPAATAQALHELDEQAARGELTKPEFDELAGKLLHLSAKRIERQFFQGKERNQELLDYAESLRTRYKIGLLSNLGGDMMDGFFAPAEREKFFDTVVLSGEVRMAKPDPEIFELTCERLGVEPAEAVMVDDVASNCEAARSVGMGAVCYEHFAQMKTELEVLLAA